jgi:hypothetical protein
MKSFLAWILAYFYLLRCVDDAERACYSVGSVSMRGGLETRN